MLKVPKVVLLYILLSVNFQSIFCDNGTTINFSTNAQTSANYSTKESFNLTMLTGIISETTSSTNTSNIFSSLSSTNSSTVTLTSLLMNVTSTKNLTLNNISTIQSNTTSSNFSSTFNATSTSIIYNSSTSRLTSISSTVTISSRLTSLVKNPIPVTKVASLSTLPKFTEYIYLIRFSQEIWNKDYSNPSTVLFVTQINFLSNRLKNALANFSIYSVTILNLSPGSVVSNTSLKFIAPVSNSDISNAITVNIPGASIINYISTETFPGWAVVFVAICGAGLCLIIFIIAGIFIYRKFHKKGYGQEQIEFFEMENGWRRPQE